MKPLTEYIKPALGTLAFVVLVGGYYWWEHRPHHEKPETTGQALVVVAKTANACFSDLVRVTGFIVPKREAVVGADQEGSKVTDLFVREGDVVTENQELARLSPPPQQPGQQSGGRTGPVSLRAPAAGLVTEVRTIVGAPASPQAGPMFRIAVNNEIELDAEVPSVHILKLNPGATARISRDGTLFFLEDLGSTHGTNPNGKRLGSREKRLLRDGDSISVMSFSLVFKTSAKLPRGSLYCGTR